MTIVIKIGGAALEDAATLRKCARAIAELAQDGHRVVVVHGGGGALTRVLKQLGMKSEFIGGLRVTDAETRDVALMVLGGMMNKKVVAAIQAAGMPAVGFCGGDGMSFRARRKHVRGNDLGFVGEICFAEPCWIEALWQQGGIPVSGLARSRSGRRVLQRECRRNGCGLRGGMPCERTDFFDRCTGSERRGRGRNSVVEHQASTGDGRGIGSEWRHVAQAGCVPASAKRRRRTRADIACGRSGSVAAVLPHEIKLRHRSHLRMSAGIKNQKHRHRSKN